MMLSGLLLVSTAAALPLKAYDACQSGGSDCPNGTSCVGLPGDAAIGGEVSRYCIPDDVQLCREDSECDIGYCAARVEEDGVCSFIRVCKEGTLGLAGPCQINADTFDCRRRGCGAGLICKKEDTSVPSEFARNAAALQTSGICQPKPPPARPLEAYDTCRSGGIETGPGVRRQNDCPKGTSCVGLPGDAAIGGEVSRYCIPDDVQLCAGDSECEDSSYCAAVEVSGSCLRVQACKRRSLKGEPCQPGRLWDCGRVECTAGTTCRYNSCF